MRKCSYFIFFLFKIVCLFPQASWGFQVLIKDPEKLSQQDLKNAEHLVATVSQKLPLELKKNLSSTIFVSFINFPKETRVLGYAVPKQNHIFINKDTLNWNSKQRIHEFEITYSLALTNLAHEIAHLYDENTKNLIKNVPVYCESIHQQESQNPAQSTICQQYQSWQTKISTEPRFLSMIQSKQTTIGITSINNRRSAWPVSYASKDFRETFAVLFSYYVIDPSFACRFPQFEIYFSNHFKTIARHTACTESLKWMNSLSLQLMETPLQKIYAIDYLWASEGQASASRFGHSMFRIVVCAPERKQMGPDCYKDVKNHVVVSYAAASKESSFSSIAGLKGDYPLNLYASTLQDKQVEYNHTELRDLYASPLKLSRTQLEQLVHHLNFEHWHLDSNYYFVSQNCATEVARALLATNRNLEQSLELNTHSPRELFKRILTSDLSALKTRSEIEKNSLLFFQNSRPFLDKALNLLKPNLDPKLALTDVNSYVKLIRSEYILQIVESGTLSRQQVAAAVYLEKWRYNKIQSQLEQELLKNSLSTQKIIQEKTLEIGQVYFSLRVPAELIRVSGFYGLPMTEETTGINSEVEKALTTVSAPSESSKIILETLALIRSQLTEQRNLINQMVQKL